MFDKVLNLIHYTQTMQVDIDNEVKLELSCILDRILSKFSLFTNECPSLYFLFQRILD